MAGESFQLGDGEMNPGKANLRLINWAIENNFDISKAVKSKVIEQMEKLLRHPDKQIRVKAGAIIALADKNDISRMKLVAQQLNRMMPKKVEHSGTVNHDHLHTGTVSVEERREKVEKLLGFLARARGITLPASDPIPLDGSPEGIGGDDGRGPGPVADSGGEEGGGEVAG